MVFKVVDSFHKNLFSAGVIVHRYLLPICNKPFDLELLSRCVQFPDFDGTCAAVLVKQRSFAKNKIKIKLNKNKPIT